MKLIHSWNKPLEYKISLKLKSKVQNGVFDWNELNVFINTNPLLDHYTFSVTQSHWSFLPLFFLFFYIFLIGIKIM